MVGLLFRLALFVVAAAAAVIMFIYAFVVAVIVVPLLLIAFFLLARKHRARWEMMVRQAQGASSGISPAGRPGASPHPRGAPLIIDHDPNDLPPSRPSSGAGT